MVLRDSKGVKITRNVYKKVKRRLLRGNNQLSTSSSTGTLHQVPLVLYVTLHLLLLPLLVTLHPLHVKIVTFMALVKLM